jgi:glycosyltransferase involved in cell wall biosynthesis
MPLVNCTLIISVYNWSAALNICLLSILKQTHLPDEVIIAADGSGKEMQELIKHYQLNFPVPLHYVWHEDNGFRKTIILNKAVHKSSSAYIIQVDGDVILDKHFIADHLEVFEPDTFIRGTRAMLTAQKTAEILSTNNIELTAFSAGVKHRNNAFWFPALSFLATRKKMSSNSVRGSNLAFWKSDFIKVNGYDNTILGWGHEDEELAARFVNNNIIKKIVKLRAVQYHLHHQTASKINEPQQRQLVEKIKSENIKVCTNGYQQAAAYQ